MVLKLQRIKDMTFQIIYSVCFVFVQYLAISNAGCKEGRFNINETACRKCPSTCAACVSDTNCTRCIEGFFGDFCKTPCIQSCSAAASSSGCQMSATNCTNCTDDISDDKDNCSSIKISDGCHRQYGYCTYGCPDGHYATSAYQGCTKCPENCSLCNSTSNCFTCKNGFYGPSCSMICSPECANGSCNQSTGDCLQCTYGYNQQSGKCLQCSGGCRSCVNITHCSHCQKSHIGPFQGRCIRKCSANLTHFISNSSQRCEVPIEKILHYQSSCLTVKVTKSYSCATLRYCVDCGISGDDCPLRTTDGDMCVRYEQCSTVCSAPTDDQVVRGQDTTNTYAYCNQTCLIDNADDSKAEQVCPLTTGDNRTRSIEEIVHIVCTQEPEMVTHSIEDPSRPIAVFVLLVTFVIFVVMIVTLMYLYRRLECGGDKSPVKMIGLSSKGDIEGSASSVKTKLGHGNTAFYHGSQTLPGTIMSPEPPVLMSPPTIHSERSTGALYLTPTTERVYEIPD